MLGKYLNSLNNNNIIIGVVLPKERDSTLAVGGIIQSSKIMAGAYSSESAEILKQNTNMVVTSPMLYDYIMVSTKIKINNCFRPSLN